MSDVFEIKGIRAEFIINGVSYKLADPQFMKKIVLQKKMAAISKDMDPVDYAISMYGIMKEMIQLYLPEFPSEKLDSIGDNALTELFTKIQEVANKKFNAVEGTGAGKLEAAP